MFEEFPDLAFQLKALAAVAAIVSQVPPQRLPLPPGPPGHWLFGTPLPRANLTSNLPANPNSFAEWINQYGPIISLRIGPKTMVIIGRHQESVDIMEKEGGLLADRPRAVAAGEIMSRGEQFRRLRRAAHTHLQAKAAESYGPIQMQAARDVILDLLDDPKHHQAHANRYAASSTPTGTNAPEIIMIHKMLKRFQMLMRPGALLVERYPIFKYVPFYASYLETWRKEESKLFHDQLNRVSQELKTGSPGPSFAKYLLENQNTHKLSSEEMAYLCRFATAVAIMVVVMAAACHPKAQDDNVIGRHRAPTFDDYNALPQIEAFMLECLRWRPVTTLGFAHRAMTDIPYGAIVFGNHWAISRDPAVYPNPDAFDPQRWLNSEGKIRDDLKFPSFGFGRRICPGQHIANRSIFINAALLMWSFRITQDPNSPIDDKGFVDGVIAHPKPF
ncbi:cytochrome P450 [Melanogaster broomeanus]|nr:cytochrome P450 [Melanogaster broomeanus]